MMRRIAVVLALAGCGFKHPSDVAPPDTVAVDASPRPSFDSFVLRAVDNPVLLADVKGAINGTDISLVVPFATPIDSLVPTFAVSAGASVRIGTAPQTSGSTAADFRAPLFYTLVSSDGTEADYRVTLSVAALPPLSFASTVNVPTSDRPRTSDWATSTATGVSILR
jgi:predicted small lipoprotein YifL